MKRIILIVVGVLAALGITYAVTKKSDETDKTKTGATTSKSPTIPQTAEQLIAKQAADLVIENTERTKLGLPPKIDPGPSHS